MWYSGFQTSILQFLHFLLEGLDYTFCKPVLMNDDRELSWCNSFRFLSRNFPTRHLQSYCHYLSRPFLEFWAEKAFFNFSMVALDVEEFVGTASIQCASTTPWGTLCQETDQHSLVGVGERKAYVATLKDVKGFRWQLPVHLTDVAATYFSNSEFILGHHF